MDDVEKTLDYFTRQCRHAVEDVEKLSLSVIEEINEINICAMGASAFGYHIVKALFENTLRVPILLHNDYILPNYITNNSLIFLVSYSGSTEEILTLGSQAFDRNANVFGITQGGSGLSTLLKEHESQYYEIKPVYNPSMQPRMATGYTITGLMMMLLKLGLLTYQSNDFLKALDFVDKNLSLIKSEAENLASRLIEKQLVLIAGEHLTGNVHILRNQFNESAKNYSAYNLLPELNHHLLEGMKHPLDLPHNTSVLIFNSHLYSPKISQRTKLTVDIMQKYKLGVELIEVLGDDKLSQVFCFLAFGGYLSYYLAQKNKEDPKSIPFVDYFKEKLSAHYDK